MNDEIVSNKKELSQKCFYSAGITPLRKNDHLTLLIDITKSKFSTVITKASAKLFLSLFHFKVLLKAIKKNKTCSNHYKT